MWDGFGRKARGKVLSGLRGAGFRDGEGAEKQKRRFWKKEKEIGIALAIAAGILVTAGGGYRQGNPYLLLLLSHLMPPG